MSNLKYKIGFVIRIEVGFQAYSRLDLERLDRIITVTKEYFNVEHIKYSDGEYIFIYCTETPIVVASFHNNYDYNNKITLKLLKNELEGIMDINKEHINISINDMYYYIEECGIIVDIQRTDGQDDRTDIICDLYNTKMSDRWWNNPQVKTKELLG